MERILTGRRFDELGPAGLLAGISKMTERRIGASNGEGRGFLRQRRLVWLLWLAALAALSVIAFALSCATGSVHIRPGLVARIILSKLGLDLGKAGWDAAKETIVMQIRLPRVAIGFVVGASLGVVGTAFQCILRNPLADPFILGVSSGAALGATVAMVAGITVPFLPGAGTGLVAFVFAMLATLFIYRISMVHGTINPHTLILCGVILNCFLSSVMMLIYSAASPQRVHSLLLWLMGDLEGVSDWMIVPMLILAAGIAALALLGASMNTLSLGDEAAFSLGTDVARVKRAIFVICAVIVGAGVSATGMIGFVGLVAPHISRTLVCADHRFVIPSSALIGATIVVLADAFGRWLIAPAELPVGAVTSLIGAPFFIYLLRAKSKIVWTE